MNKKWYISAFVVILAFFGGIITQEQLSKPNQEIVLQFTSNTVTTDEANATISIISQKLHAAGVTNIHVAEYSKGQLKIVYHSTTDISSIKAILSQEKSIDFDSEVPASLPSEEQQIGYNFDVFEIRNGQDADLSIKGTLGADHKESQELVLSPNPFANVNTFTYSIAKSYHSNGVEYNKYIGVLCSHIAYKIPEVRAGPLPKGRYKS